MYSAITTYGKTTLPSVESWYTSSNIEKDPPKGIHTRRKTRVGDNNDLILTMSEAEDRICENINYYARGVNPMVSVNYGQGQSGATSEAYLPYRVARDGAFRPPIYRPEDLMPLSRQPRNKTAIYASKDIVDGTRKLVDRCCKSDIKDMLKIACETQKIIQKNPELSEPILELPIKDPLKAEVSANVCYDKCYFNNMEGSDKIQLGRNLPNHEIRLNNCTSYEINNSNTDVKLKPSRNYGTAFTNNVGQGKDQIILDPVYRYIFQKNKFDRELNTCGYKPKLYNTHIPDIQLQKKIVTAY